MVRVNRVYMYLAAVVLIVYAVSCSSPTDDYKKLVKSELAKGTRVDSLFLGISFGMTSKTFFAYCWELNKKGLLMDGANNSMVLYKMDSALKFPASMLFYPDFYNNRIYHMRVSFQYNAWAIWNKAQYSDTLLPDVLRLLKKWYPHGNQFLPITDKTRGTIYVKVDGNRQITVGRYDDMIVKVDYTDLVSEEKLKAEEKLKK